MRRRGSRAAAAVTAALAALAALAAAGPAAAHDPFQITTEARLTAAGLSLHVTMFGHTAQKACAGTALEACARGLYHVTGGGVALPPRAVRAGETQEEDVDMTVDYPRPASGPLRLEATYLARLGGTDYGAELTVTGDGRFLGQALLRAEQPAFETALPGGAVTPAPAMPRARAYLELGVRHILSGPDHLLFLLGLLVACRRLRAVLAIVTCFTVAHSVTLALAALGVVTLPPRVVEPFIAATLLFVGLENLVRGEEPRGRWALTFAFGLAHGLGFAGALRDTGLGAAGAPIALPLLTFNLGVELGQLAVAALCWAALQRLRASPRFARAGGRVASALVAAAGCYWLVARVAAG